MKPAAGTRLFFIGTEGVLFSAPRQELHAFNTTACVIWCHLEDGLTEPEIADALVRDSGIDASTAREHVRAAMTDWAAKGLAANGLLGDAPPVPVAEAPGPRNAYLPPPLGVGFAVVRHYRMSGISVRIRFAHASHAALVHPLLAHLTEPEEGRGSAGHSLDIIPVDDWIGFYLDGEAEGFCRETEEIAPSAKAVVWTAVLRRQDFLLHVHAAVIDGPGGCVLLPAAAGSGKSTLAIGLVHAGYRLFSDEVALLATQDLSVAPFPMALCVKDSGIDVVAALYPRVRDLPLHRRGDGRRVVYLPPPPESVPRDGMRSQVSGIVFPRYEEGAATRSRVVPPVEALTRLLAQCLNVGRDLDAAAIGRLVRWIGPMRCVEIEYGSLDSARDLIVRRFFRPAVDSP